MQRMGKAAASINDQFSTETTTITRHTEKQENNDPFKGSKQMWQKTSLEKHKHCMF